MEKVKEVPIPEEFCCSYYEPDVLCRDPNTKRCESCGCFPFTVRGGLPLAVRGG
jgi:hypothetical protein